ncbi:hypothetical protein [Amycolatopsis sp. lyj-108]|uniref:hypothetical protein n=1 Tax=Amycolatopsis sp. lyj-108 TaxID=2789286 RepID=UPI0039788166
MSLDRCPVNALVGAVIVGHDAQQRVNVGATCHLSSWFRRSRIVSGCTDKAIGRARRGRNSHGAR